MHNTQPSKVEELLQQLKAWARNLYSRTREFLSSYLNRENYEKGKQAALRWEQRTHRRFDHWKEDYLTWEQKAHEHIDRFRKDFKKESQHWGKTARVKAGLLTENTLSLAKRTQRKHGKKFVSKGLFSFNIIYGVIRNIIVAAVFITALLGFFGVGAGLGFFASLISDETPPSRDAMAAAIGDVELISTMHYADGEIISEFRTDLQRTIVTGEQISPFIKEGLIATEDEHFYEHNGMVPKAVLRAVITEVTGMGNTTGGSTITQQLIKQQILSPEVTFTRKANEILLAMRLENYFDKDQILTAYLNVSPFGRNSNGRNVAGIEEAARGIFGVPASEVNLPQAAFLVGLPQNPYVYTPYTQYGERQDASAGIERMKTVLYRMYAENYITKEEYEQALAYDIESDFVSQQETQMAQHNFLYQQIEKQAIETLMTLEAEQNGLTFADLDADVDLYNEYYFRNEALLNTSGYKVYSTIDKDIHNAMQEAVNAYKDDIGPTYVDTVVDEETGNVYEITELAQAGGLMTENATGRILGFIGGTDFSVDQVDHAFDAYRSPGSTIKPLAVYAPAIEMNVITPASMLPDTPVNYTDAWSGESWEVSNIGNKVSNRLVDARSALYNSMNNPTANLYISMLEKGLEPYQYMDKMNFQRIDEEKIYPPFSLGSTQVTMREQTAAFSTFANQGNYVDSYLIEKIEDREGDVIFQHESQVTPVFTPQTAYLTLDILRDVVDQGFSRQIKGFLNFNADIAAKTGTSEFNQDYWFIGSTPTVTLSHWTGYNNKFETHVFDDPGATGWPSVNNMRFWATIANKVHEVKPEVFGTNLTHQRPEGIVEKEVVADTGMLPGRVSIPNSNTTINIDGAKKKELFKEDNQPQPMKYDFAPSASPEELRKLYWDSRIRSVREAQQKLDEEAKKRIEAEAKKKTEDEAKQAEEAAKQEAAKQEPAQQEAAKQEAEQEKEQEQAQDSDSGSDEETTPPEGNGND